jgi:hypothetical protein
MTDTADRLLILIRAAMWGESPDASKFMGADWKGIFHLADIETVSCLVLDGISLLSKEVHPPLPIKLQRIAQMQKVERVNRLHRSIIARIQDALETEGIVPVFMKGQVTALRYPQPLHRQPGDIDFVIGSRDFSKTLDILERLGRVDRTLVHEHHGMAWIDGVTVEPHYKVHNYQRPSTDEAMREMFGEIYPEHLSRMLMDGKEICVFPPTFESVFLISHLVNHVYEEGLGLRQVIDYALFFNRCNKNIDWTKHAEYLKLMRMERAWRIFTCLCVNYLGLQIPPLVIPFTQKEEDWATRLMSDIIHVGNFGRGEYIFQYNTINDIIKNYCWVVKRCYRLGFVCPSEARWWVLSKIKRFFWKKSKEFFHSKS